MNKKIVVIIQARMGSTRLPGKVLKYIKGKSILEHVVRRVKQCKKIDEIVIATTNLEQDNQIVNLSKELGTIAFRGSELDLLSRYYNAAKFINADIIIRVTSDCPMIDPIIVDQMIEFYLNNNYDIVTNTGLDIKNRTYPRG
ncbi:MAG: cytidylyltransferase domain-containing protein, partial [Peptostreptococcaceae bacterium]